MKRIYFFIALFITMMAVMYPSQHALQGAKSSPAGIVSLEFAGSVKNASTIRRDWDSSYIVPKPGNTACYAIQKTAKDPKDKLLANGIRNTQQDFMYILVYGLLLWNINLRVNSAYNRRKKAINLMILSACLLDVIENIFMLLFMSSSKMLIALSGMPLFSIAAIMKFVLLGIVCIAIIIAARKWIFEKLVEVTKLLKDLSFVFRYSPLTIISLFVLFFTVWMSDQGQDLLLTINNDKIGPAVLYTVVTILAIMNWYFPKFFLGVDWEGKKLRDLFSTAFDFPQVVEQDPNKVAIPRIFGVLTYLIPAFGILKVLAVFGIWNPPDQLPLILLVITTIIIHVCFKKDYFKRLYEKRRWLFNLLCIACFLAPFIAFIFTTKGPGDLFLLFTGLFFHSLLFAFITANRMSIAIRIKMLDSKRLTPTIWLVTIVPVLLFAFYALCNTMYWPGLPFTFLSFTIVMSGIIAYYALFTILNVLAKKINVNISLFIVLMCMVTASNCTNHFHYVDQQTTTHKTKTTLPQYITKWLEDRYAIALQQPDSYNIYIVNTYGGGIRASSWTCFVMAKLDSLQNVNKPGELFQDHVLAYSGASGGTVGASILCANGFRTGKPVPTSGYYHFYSNDFLTAVLTGMIGNDIWYACLGITSGKDRSKVQEHLWEHYFHDQFNESDLYGYTEDTLWNGNNTRVPLLFSNTTDVKQGSKGIMAPVLLDSADFPGTTFVRDLMDNGHTLKLSTSAFMSARFPYLSPAGGFDQSHHFLDGGIVENSGAETAMQIYNVLKRMIDTGAGGKYKGHFKVSILSLHNAYHSDTSVTEKKKNLSQLMAPVTGAISVGLTGNTTKADNINKHYFNGGSNNSPAYRYYKIEPIVEQIWLKPRWAIRSADSVQVPLPLGWSISDIALRRMMESVNLLCDTNKNNRQYRCDPSRVGQLYYIINKP